MVFIIPLVADFMHIKLVIVNDLDLRLIKDLTKKWIIDYDNEFRGLELSLEK